MTANSPNIVLISQYLKNLRFEAPERLPDLAGRNSLPEIKVEMKVDFRRNRQDVTTWEMSINIVANALLPQKSEICIGPEKAPFIFRLEFCYGAVVGVATEADRGFRLKSREELVHLVFPACRNILARMTRAGGFPELVLNLSDFETAAPLPPARFRTATVAYSGHA